jgi:hypothetical protein
VQLFVLVKKVAHDYNKRGVGLFHGDHNFVNVRVEHVHIFHLKVRISNAQERHRRVLCVRFNFGTRYSARVREIVLYHDTFGVTVNGRFVHDGLAEKVIAEHLPIQTPHFFIINFNK